VRYLGFLIWARSNSILKAFVSVAIGNLVYFIMKHWLPESLRHKPFHLDWGLVADFWFCLLVWGALDLILRLAIESLSRREH
jgi:hypothetical protein